MAVPCVCGGMSSENTASFPSRGAWPRAKCSHEFMKWQMSDFSDLGAISLNNMNWENNNKTYQKRSSRITVHCPRTPEFNFGGEKEVHSVLKIWESCRIRSVKMCH